MTDDETVLPQGEPDPEVDKQLASRFAEGETIDALGCEFFYDDDEGDESLPETGHPYFRRRAFWAIRRAYTALLKEQSERPASFENALAEYDNALARGCDNKQAGEFMIAAIRRVNAEQAKREVTLEDVKYFEGLYERFDQLDGPSPSRSALKRALEVFLNRG